MRGLYFQRNRHLVERFHGVSRYCHFNHQTVVLLDAHCISVRPQHLHTFTLLRHEAEATREFALVRQHDFPVVDVVDETEFNVDFGWDTNDFCHSAVVPEWYRGAVVLGTPHVYHELRIKLPGDVRQKLQLKL